MKALDRILQRIRVRMVLPYVRAGARVLDVGCADGALLRLAPRLGEYVGVDPDAPRDARPGVRFVRGTFPCPELDGAAPFDVITLLAVLEHVPRTEQRAFAERCAASLVAGGTLAITVPSPLVDRILDVLIRIRVLDGMEEGQHYGFDPDETPSLFGRAGFRLVRHARFELGLNHLYVFRREPRA